MSAPATACGLSSQGVADGAGAAAGAEARDDDGPGDGAKPRADAMLEIRLTPELSHAGTRVNGRDGAGWP